MAQPPFGHPPAGYPGPAGGQPFHPVPPGYPAQPSPYPAYPPQYPGYPPGMPVPGAPPGGYAYPPQPGYPYPPPQPGMPPYATATPASPVVPGYHSPPVNYSSAPPTSSMPTVQYSTPGGRPLASPEANARPQLLPALLKQSPHELLITNIGFPDAGKSAASLTSEQLADRLSGGLQLHWYRSDNAKKPHQVTLLLSPKRLHLVLRHDNEVKLQIWLAEIDELRLGQKTQVFEEAFPNNPNNPYTNLSLSVIYSKKTLDLVCNRPEDFDLLVGAVSHFARKIQNENPLQAHVDRVWERFGKDSLPEKEVSHLFEMMNMQADHKTVKKLLAEVDANEDKRLSYDEFERLVRMLHDRHDVRELFQRYSNDKKELHADELLRFLQQEQHETLATLDYAQKLIQFVANNPNAHGLTQEQFQDFMVSDLNSLLHASTSQVWQDMKQPLPAYWCASSHNTYLEADQLRGRSSIDQYIRVLAMGCRCVELDCWDGEDGDVIIFHGHTLTSKIRFIDVLRAIKEHAFVRSPYPVILSLEMHCKAPNQDKIARYLREVFGDQLAIPNPDAPLPSPDELKNKIVVKGKEEGESSTAALTAVTMLRATKFKSLPDCAKLKSLMMFSWEESLLEKHDRDMVVKLTMKHFIRSYPAGTKVGSANYDPTPWWAVGTQLVALNYQTASKPMTLNRGRFLDNGGAGYVLKPAVLRDPPSGVFQPELKNLAPISTSAVQRMEIRVLDARNLPKKGNAGKNKGKGEIVDPYVTLSIWGAKADRVEHSTSVVDNNGFNPVWQQTKMFHLVASEIALLLIRVHDKDTVGSDEVLAQFCCPVEAIRPGWRVVPLNDDHNRPLFGATLFLHIRINM